MSGIYDDENNKTFQPRSLRERFGLKPRDKKNKESSPTDLANQEASDTPSQDSQSVSQEKRALGSSSEGDTKDQAPKFRILGKTNRRKAFVIGVSSGGIIGIILAISGFLSGPLQLVQFAQLLEQFHFSDNADFMDGRVGKLIKYARTTDNPERRELGSAGNKVADHYEKRLKAAGMEPVYEARRIRAITIDPSTVEGREALEKMKKKGADITYDANGKATVALEGSARSRRQAISGMVDSLGMSKVSSSLAARVLKVRGAVDFHPLKNVSRAADERFRVNLDEYKKKIKDQRNNSIENGVEPTSASANQRVGDPDNPATDADTRTANEIDSGMAELNTIAADPELSNTAKVNSIKGKLGAGIGATAVIGTVCGLQQLGIVVRDTQESNIIQPLLRSGMHVVTVGSQIMWGGDVNMDEVGALSEDLYDPETGTSWASAKSVQAELGQEQTGPDIPESAKPGKDGPAFFKAVDEIIGFIPGGDAICGAINSTLGGLALTIGGIIASATGPASAGAAAVSEIVQDRIMATFMDDIVRVLAGNAVDIAGAKGADYGNYATYGAFLASNNQAMSFGGSGLSMTDRVGLRSERDMIIRDEIKQKGWYARMFDAKDPNSLVAKLMISNPDALSVQKNVASISKLPTLTLSAFRGLIPGVKAQTQPFDYGVDKIGFNLSEIDSDAYDNPYQNEDRVINKLEALNGKYGKCFGTTVDPGTGKLKIGAAPSYTERETFGGMCDDRNNTELTDYRFYLADKTAMATTLCYESIDESACAELAIEGQPDTTPTDNSSPENGQAGIGPDGFVFPLETTKSTIEGSILGWVKGNNHGTMWGGTIPYYAYDIGSPQGTKVVAPRAGTVKRVKTGSEQLSITIEGSDGYWYFFQHLDPAADAQVVRENDVVGAGQLIGHVGPNAINASSGANTPPHLHFSVSREQLKGSSRGCSRSACPNADTLIDVLPQLTASYERLSP